MTELDTRLANTLAELHDAGTYKLLRNITAPMDTRTRIAGVGEVLVFCSNNYLGLANHPRVLEAARDQLVLHPGVHRAIEATAAQGTNALLTGNWRSGAALKLGQVSLWDRFAFGAFGDDSGDRNDLVPVAEARARQAGVSFSRTVVIGDTPADVACARAGGGGGRGRPHRMEPPGRARGLRSRSPPRGPGGGAPGAARSVISSGGSRTRRGCHRRSCLRHRPSPAHQNRGRWRQGARPSGLRGPPSCPPGGSCPQAPRNRRRG